MDGVTVAHLGDLGHALDARQLKELGTVHILLTPVGGSNTIDGPTASRLADAVGPRVIIPMHFRNVRCSFPISDATAFLALRRNVRRVVGSEAEFAADALPAATETAALEPAMWRSGTGVYPNRGEAPTPVFAYHVG